MLFLARSMCVNLSSMSYGSQGEDAKYGPLDHLRAYAGTYYMNTVVFTTNKKPDLMMNTKQLENCCKVLESTMELESDEYLVKLVKVQQLAQTISTTMAGETGPMSLPIMMVVQSFQDQVDTFRASLPEHLAANPTLLCHLSVGETLLKDFAISDQRCSPEKMQVTDRLQLLWSCVRSLKAFFDVRFAEPEVERPRFLILIASDLAYTLITGLKLLTLQLPGWELESLHAELPMSTVLGKQIDHITEVMSRRKSGLLSPDRCDVEDPLERLMHLLKMAQAVVNMHVAQGGSPFAAIVNELSGEAFQDMVGGDAGSWGLGDAQGLINMAAQS